MRRAAVILLALSFLSACGPGEKPTEQSAAPEPAATRPPPRKLEWTELRVRTVEGSVRSGEEPVRRGEILRTGPTLTLGVGALLVVSFPDDARLTVRGPSVLVVEEATDYARTIRLEAGTVERLEAKKIVTGVKTSEDVFIALKEAAASISIEETDEVRRMSFVLLAGEDAKIVDGNALVQPSIGDAVVIDRPR